MVWQPQRVTNWFRPVKKLSLCGYSAFLNFIFHLDRLWKSIITMIHITSLNQSHHAPSDCVKLWHTPSWSLFIFAPLVKSIIVEHNLVSNFRLDFECWISNFLLKFQSSSEIGIRTIKRSVSKAQSSVGLVFFIQV